MVMDEDLTQAIAEENMAASEEVAAPVRAAEEAGSAQEQDALTGDESAAGETPDGAVESDDVLVVGGFHFLTKADAEKAQVDAIKIDRIRAHMGYTTAPALRAVYEKSIENKIFATPVGWVFLHGLREQLGVMGVDTSSMMPIPLPIPMTHEPLRALSALPPTPLPEKEKKTPFGIVMLLMNLVLVGLVVAMFFILTRGDTDNMLNYKRNVANRYATWEQDLTERERAVRVKERELGIEGGSEESGAAEP